jgi:hypothetical protein
MQADLMAESFSFPEKTPSLSCLHAIEHFGLGRYGDPIDLDGHKKGIKNIPLSYRKYQDLKRY